MGLFDSLRKRLGRQKSGPPEHLIALSTASGRAVPAGRVEDPLDVVRSCRDRSATVRSYRSQAIIRDATVPPAMDGPVTYVLEAIRPDQFHVWQEAWMGTSQVYDEWITLGADHYDNVGAWGKSIMPQRKEVNGALAFEAFLQILGSIGSHECLPYTLDARPYLKFEADLPPPVLAQGRDAREPITTLWIDGENWLPAKVQASAAFEDEGVSARLELEQVFYDFDADISISAPKVQLKAR